MEKDQNSSLRGFKKTKQRKCVLSVLERAANPLSVPEIYTRIQEEGERICLSTIYRILDSFMKKGMVMRMAAMHNSTAVYELNRLHHKHYAVCMGCHKMFPILWEHLMPKVDNDFHVLGHNLEVYGYCKHCGPK